MSKAMATINKHLEDSDSTLLDPMQEHAIEFANWLATNYRPTVASGELKYWQFGSYQNKDRFYSTEELYEIFNNSITQ